MKKIIMLGLVGVLAACNNTVKPQENADDLILVKSEPKNCVYLYKMDADASFYSHDDAVQYLKNRIAAQNKTGNVFWLSKDEKIQNEWVMFGPEYKYSLTAKVYDCPITEKK